ncbi:MAG TPA: DNRLRE domain-containing protein [Chthonomonadaceae bacterium]|nr:DNRLRE domain-containing protein [Chthonomonadaceae bacterium]
MRPLSGPVGRTDGRGGYLAMAALLILLTAGSHASAQTLTLVSSKDNTLYEDATGSLSNGAGANFFAGETGNGLIRRGLLAFDLSAIPTGAKIDSVALTLSMSRTVSGSETISLYRVLADWGEGTSNATGQEGAGAPATTNDATWIHRFYNTQTWATPGGDFASAASATRTVGGVGSYTWASTPQLVADVQGWVDNPSTNFGWAVIGNESAASTAKRFDTRENPVAANRPSLFISYTVAAVPGPASLPIFAGGLCAGLGYLRRRCR